MGGAEPKLEEVLVPRKGKRVARAKVRSVPSGRYRITGHKRDTERTVVKDSSPREPISKAGRFAKRFIEEHPDTFHELSKR